MTDKDREAFEKWAEEESFDVTFTGRSGFFMPTTKAAWEAWQAAAAHYAPKLTEAVAVEKVARSLLINLPRAWATNSEYVHAAKEVLKAAGVRFKDEP